MIRTFAVIALFLGIVTVSFASSSFLHLQQIAFNRDPENPLDQLDFRILTAGMSDHSTTGVIRAADVSRPLQTRVFLVFGVGLVLILTGGVVLLRPRKPRHEPNVDRGSVRRNRHSMTE